MPDTKFTSFNPMPQTLCLQISNVCFFRCKMCYYWQHQTVAGALTDKQLMEFLPTLRGHVPPGFRVELCASGEPLGRKGIIDLIKTTISLGFDPHFTTNAYLLDKEMIDYLDTIGVRNLSISVDSLREETHDFLRGMPGAYSRAMAAINYLIRKRTIKVAIASTIMGANLRDIVPLARWVHAAGLEGIRFQAIRKPFNQDLPEKWYQEKDWQFLWPQDLSQVHRVIDELISLKQQHYRIGNPEGHLELFKAYFDDPHKSYRLRKCNCGDFVLNVDMYGNVTPCGTYGPMGNIKDQHILDIWHSEKAQNIRQQISSCSDVCHYLVNCYYAEEKTTQTD